MHKCLLFQKQWNKRVMDYDGSSVDVCMINSAIGYAVFGSSYKALPHAAMK